MAEAIGVASGVLTLAAFAWESSRVLCQTVESFQTSKRDIRELKQELKALEPILESLNKVASNTDSTYATLKVPLYGCGTACREFAELIEKCAPRADLERRSFRDWARLRWRGDNIEEFKKVLSSYKATINIAIGDINM
jgi:hypothetical protein